MPWVLLLLLGPPLQDADQALARQVARSVELYATYTGEWPESLDDLVRKPNRVAFWPEGGYWFGEIPSGVSWKKGRVICGAASIAVAPPTRSAIVPPTDRLREFYTARVRLQLLHARVEATIAARGEIPKKIEDVPKDPWGKPFLVKIGKNRVRLAVEDPGRRTIEPTREERRALEEAGRARLSDGDRRTLAALIDRFADDDLEPREEAEEALRRFGPAAGPLIRERAKNEKDAEIRGRLARLAREFPELPPAWETELAPLVAVALGRLNPRAEQGCMNNLSQLWKMQCNYMVLFGGADKLMPTDSGKDFWLALSRTTPPLIDTTLLDIFICPLSDEEAKAGVCTYFGPASDVNKMDDGDPVGMCDDEAHREAIILRKSGDVQTVKRDDPLYKLAIKKLKR